MWGRKSCVLQVVRDKMVWEFRLGRDISIWKDGVGVSLVTGKRKVGKSTENIKEGITIVLFFLVNIF